MRNAGQVQMNGILITQCLVSPKELPPNQESVVNHKEEKVVWYQTVGTHQYLLE